MKLSANIDTDRLTMSIVEMSSSLDLHANDGDIASQGLERQETRASRHSKRNDSIQGPEEALELQHSRASRRDDAEPGLPEVPEEEMTNVASIEPVPPNGGYGWVCTLAVFLINSHTWGVNAVSLLPRLGALI